MVLVNGPGTVADKRGRAFRKSHVSDTGDVRNWLSKILQNADEISIRQFEIIVLPPIEDDALNDAHAFKVAFRNKRDSDLHSLLKYSAWLWLVQEESVALPCQSDLVRYEQMIYSATDIESAASGAKPLGGEFDGTMSQLIRRGDHNVTALDGKIITVDVFGKGTNIEIGNTTPINLMTPLLDCLSERAVWLPYPNKMFPKDFQMETDRIESTSAYEISYG